MAVDEALLSSVEEGPIFRIYGWNEWTLSLGRFQDTNDGLLSSFVRAPSFSVVRRMTGGGAILHGGELTYSLVLHQDDLGTGNVKESFRLLCGFLLRFYRKLGLDAMFAGDAAVTKADVVSTPVLGAKTPFCYAGREIYDILVRRRPGDYGKIGGNAQRRFRKVIFQHGSIPIVLNREGLRHVFPPEALPPADDITALAEVDGSGKSGFDSEGSSRESLVSLLRESFLELAAHDLRARGVELSELLEHERSVAAALERDVYRTREWTWHRRRSG